MSPPAINTSAASVRRLSPRAEERLNEASSVRGTDWWARGPVSPPSALASRPTIPGARITRERWLLVLFEELGYGRLVQREAASRSTASCYPVFAHWEQHADPSGRVQHAPEPPHRASPAQLIRARTASSRSFSTALTSGFGDSSPTVSFCGCFATTSSLTRQAYVEFDLEAMLDSEVYADFVVLWLVCHQSRVEGDRRRSAGSSAGHAAGEDGTRALGSAARRRRAGDPDLGRASFQAREHGAAFATA